MLGPESLPIDFLKGDEVGSSSRILFVGGCHINGFPVGEEYAFPHVALGCLSEHRENTLYALPLLNLRSGSQIQAACRDLRPDAVVLQLGHYEAPTPLRKSLRLRGADSGRTSAVGAARPSRSRPEMQYRLSPSTMFKGLRRIAAAGMIVALGKKRRMFDPTSIAARLDSLLASLREFPLKGIVLMSPFSAPDPITHFLRRRTVPIFEAAAKKHGCTFVDLFSYLESYPNGGAFRGNFADPQHLSVLGHQRVGVLVGAALKRVMEQSTATEAEPVKAAPIKDVARASGSRWAGRPVVALHS